MAATVPPTKPTTNMSPTCHACGQRFGQIKAPLLHLVPPAEDALTLEKKKKKKKKKKNKLKDTADKVNKVNKTTGPGVSTTLGNLLDLYAQDWIPGYHFAKRVVGILCRSTRSPTTALTIFSVYTVTTSSDPIVDSIAKKRKRPKHKKKKKTTSLAASPIQEQPPKSKLPLPASSPSRRTCRRCHQVFKSRNELFKHLNACVYGASSTSIPKHTQADGTNNTAETAKAPKPFRISERIKRLANASSLRTNKGKEAGLPLDSLKGGCSLVAANCSPSPTTILKAASPLASPAESPEAPKQEDIQERKQPTTTRGDLPCYPTDPVEPEEEWVVSPFWCRSCLDICNLSSHHQRFRFPVQRELRTWPFGVEFALIPVPALSLHSPRNIGLPQDQVCRPNKEVEDSSYGA